MEKIEGVQWDAIGSFERHPKLKLKVGEKADVVFQDDGKLVPASLLAEKMMADPNGRRIKARDSYVFTLAVGAAAFEWWQGTQSYGVLTQLKSLRDKNGGTLKGAKATMTRVSDSPDQTNWTVV